MKEEANIWGQRDLQRAMQAFADDWWVHRKRIDGRLDKLSKEVDQCCGAWTDADKQLTDSLGTESDDA